MYESHVVTGNFLCTLVFPHALTTSRSEQMATHALFETASGYAIFQVDFREDIGFKSKQVQDSINDLAKFGKMVSLISFSPFKNAAHALENANDVSEGM